MHQLRKLSVVFPVFNEEPTVETLIRRVLAVELPKEVIIVDDASTDQTPAILGRLAQDPGMAGTVVFLQHSRNRGKGAAIRTALERVEGDVVIIQDADLELDPAEYVELLQPILDGKADVVYGSRFLGRARNVPRRTRLANRFLTLLTNILFRGHLTDMETAYKVFRRDILKDIKLRSVGFDFEAEITAKLLRSGHRIHEVPISYNPRTEQEGKKISWIDGVETIYTLLKYRFY